MQQFEEIECIVFKAGHSQSDPGAIGDDWTTPDDPDDIVKEHELNRDLTIQTAMNFDSEESIIINDDENLSLSEATIHISEIFTEKGCTWRTGILISLHCDWSGAPSGTMAYYLDEDSDKGRESKRFAEILVKKVSEKLGVPNRGVRKDTASRWGSLGILRDPKNCLPVLLEMGAIGVDLDKLKFRQLDYAQGVKEAIAEFTGDETQATESIQDLYNFNVKNQKKIYGLVNEDSIVPREIEILANNSAKAIRKIQKITGLDVSD